MSNAYLSPILNDAQFNDDGTFLVGGLIWFYAAGTTTPIAAYTDPTAAVAWSNPIVLDARGETGGEIWLTAGQGYKMILEAPPLQGQTHGVVVSTFDNITGVNDPVTNNVDSWIFFDGTPYRLSDTSFSVSGDHRDVFQLNRRLKSINGATTIYSTIESSVYASGVTTVTVVNDTGTLTTELTQVFYSFVETSPSAIPKAVLTGSKTTSTSSDIYISVSGGRLQQAVDAGSLSTTWPIDITGDVTGNVTGNLTGNVTGNVTGNLTGDVIGNLTGAVSAPDGSVSNPSIKFSTDGATDTGFYHPADGIISFACNASNVAAFASTSSDLYTTTNFHGQVNVQATGTNKTTLTSAVSYPLEMFNTGGTGTIWNVGPSTAGNFFVITGSNGVTLVSGATSWTSASDINLKDVIENIDNAVNDLSTLTPVRFTWKSDEHKKEQVGLIAQEVKKILPNSVNDTGDGYLGVQYTDIIPLLVAAVKELKTEIDELKKNSA